VPAVFCYDSKYLLVLRWPQVGREVVDLRGSPDMLLIPVGGIPVDGNYSVHVREVMYRLVCECIRAEYSLRFHAARVE
jgi:hypothetical protein